MRTEPLRKEIFYEISHLRAGKAVDTPWKTRLRSALRKPVARAPTAWMQVRARFCRAG